MNAGSEPLTFDMVRGALRQSPEFQRGYNEYRSGLRLDHDGKCPDDQKIYEEGRFLAAFVKRDLGYVPLWDANQDVPDKLVVYFLGALDNNDAARKARAA